MSDASIIAGRYQLLDIIDHGGMGTVYRARDTQADQVVAVKALKREIIAQEPTLIERFRREGEALRQLDHPNIIRVLDTPEQDGSHYIVMEYMPGGSLDQLLRTEKQLPVERALKMALDIADALTRAHRLKIIHRDIKPANVLLAADGSIRLTDFGVAQLGDVKSRITQVGALVGSIAYLSPEVCSGSPYDERSDIWAFGVMLYEMLTGINPFAKSSPAETFSAILTEVPRDLVEYRPDVPAAIAYLIDNMIAKDAQDRISSVRAIGVELETVLSQFNRSRMSPRIGTDEHPAAKPVTNTASTTAHGAAHIGAGGTGVTLTDPTPTDATEPDTDPTGGEQTTADRPAEAKQDDLVRTKTIRETAPTPAPAPVTPAPPPKKPHPFLEEIPVRPVPPIEGGTISSPPTKPITASFSRTLINDALGMGDAAPRRVADPRVFIAYRREDTGDVARKIYDVLHRELGDNDVARDVDRVANKTINRVVLAQDIVASFDAMVIIIGRQWMGLPGSGGATGKYSRALENPKDSLRIQLEAGLKRPDMLIIPVLVDGATMPTAAELPKSIAALATKTPFGLAWKPEDGDAALEAQVKRLVQQIRRHFNPKPRWVLPAGVVAVIIVILLIVLLFLLDPSRAAAAEVGAFMSMLLSG